MVDEALEADAGRSAIERGSDLHHRMAEATFAVGAPGQGVVGRHALLAEIEAFLDGPGGALVVIGASGTGKSTVLAEAATRARARPDAVTVLRLLGTTPGTSEVDSLLRDLVEELSTALQGAAAGVQERPELLARFAEMLATASPKRPIPLFLDAVDQLAPERGAHPLAWLLDSTVAAGPIATTLGLDGRMTLTGTTTGEPLGGFGLLAFAPAEVVNPQFTALALSSDAATLVTASSGVACWSGPSTQPRRPDWRARQRDTISARPTGRPSSAPSRPTSCAAAAEPRRSSVRR